MSDERPTGWKVLGTGAVGAELTLWCGFGVGKSVNHVFLRLGMVILFARRLNTHLVVRAADTIKARLRR